MPITDGIADMAVAMPGPEVAQSVASDPLADRFTVDTYSDGGCDVLGQMAGCGYFASSGLVTITLLSDGVSDQRSITSSREAMIELRDALDVMVRNTTKATGRVS